MKKSYLSRNLILIRGVWQMNRMQFGELLDCTENQIGGNERGATMMSPMALFALEDLTGIPAKRLFYEPLTRESIPIQPLRPTEGVEKETPQYNPENLSLAERVKRLEMKVFGA